MSTAVLTTPPSVSPQQVQLLRKFGRFRGRVRIGNRPHTCSQSNSVHLHQYPVTPAANPALTRFMGKGRMGFLARRAQAMGAARTACSRGCCSSSSGHASRQSCCYCCSSGGCACRGTRNCCCQAVVAPVVTPVVAPRNCCCPSGKCLTLDCKPNSRQVRAEEVVLFANKSIRPSTGILRLCCKGMLVVVAESVFAAFSSD